MQHNGKVESYRDLRVWREGMDLAEACYRLTAAFPREEVYGLTSQVRRSAASIPANIAEGYGRDGTAEYVHFLRIAQGSLKELETHLLLAQRLNLCPAAQVDPILEQTDHLGRMLRALYRSLQRAATPGSRTLREDIDPYNTQEADTPHDL